ncbi:VWA domain-containing protein [Fulvivirgaceae bacterium BMA10]|uniref:VWA domain-containing protein n=1 Tax=Splendidivirga corallicola TaxID=3051826 RepID=A0ABT8KIE1_9BACT|nr:VWA domain-containing protein [Fulvivirgaceae bacterium BMA10]
MKSKLLYCLFILGLFYGFTGTAFAQTNYQELPEKTRILFLLDASGSMLGKWENDIRINVAKSILSDLVDSLKINNNLELGLRVYGHQFHRRFQNCKDTRLEVPFRANNHELVKSKLNGLQPKGTTPLAYSLEQAANDFPDTEDVRNIVIIITDGLESCEGDPCSISLSLQKKRIFLKPFIIGIGMNKSFEEKFDCLGQFFDASNIHQFREVLNTALNQTLSKTTVSVELLDIQGQPKESNVNVTFINNVTNEAEYNFVHFRDRLGRPDSVEVDAVLSYDLQVNTIPPITRKNIHLVPGKHNVLSIKAPQGTLQLHQPGHTEYKGGVQAIIRKNGKAQTINVQDISTKETYLVGKYDLEILTLPRIFYKGIEVTQSSNKTLRIPDPGVLNIRANVTGFGSVYVVKDDGSQELIKNLDHNKTRFSFAIQPGNYRIVFRAKQAFGSKYTEIKNFTIKSGSTISINLFGR